MRSNARERRWASLARGALEVGPSLHSHGRRLAPAGDRAAESLAQTASRRADRHGAAARARARPARRLRLESRVQGRQARLLAASARLAGRPDRRRGARAGLRRPVRSRRRQRGRVSGVAAGSCLGAGAAPGAERRPCAGARDEPRSPPGVDRRQPGQIAMPSEPACAVRDGRWRSWLVTELLGSIEIERQAFSAEQRKDGDARRPGRPRSRRRSKSWSWPRTRESGCRVRRSASRSTSRRPIRKADRDGVVRFDLTQRQVSGFAQFRRLGRGLRPAALFLRSERRPVSEDSVSVHRRVAARRRDAGRQGHRRAGPADRRREGRIWGYLGEKKDKHELAYMVDATTDEQGQWRCRCFREHEVRVSLPFASGLSRRRRRSSARTRAAAAGHAMRRRTTSRWRACETFPTCRS